MAGRATLHDRLCRWAVHVDDAVRVSDPVAELLTWPYVQPRNCQTRRRLSMEPASGRTEVIFRIKVSGFGYRTFLDLSG